MVKIKTNKSLQERFYSSEGIYYFNWQSCRLQQPAWTTDIVFFKLYPTHAGLPQTKMDGFTNSVDFDEVAHNELSHLDLHCLPSSL